jgi:adenylate cyclase
MKRRDFYLKKFDLFPEFKAGIHIGIATVAEVGLVKREIAYHGDVLNTTSRIQGACNRLGQKLLVSNHLIERFNRVLPYPMQDMGLIQLRGREQSIKVYGIEPNITK